MTSETLAGQLQWCYMIAPCFSGDAVTNPMREVHVSHMIPSFWYQKNLVPECMTLKQSFWCEILVSVLGRRTWVMYHGP